MAKSNLDKAEERVIKLAEYLEDRVPPILQKVRQANEQGLLKDDSVADWEQAFPDMSVFLNNETEE